MIDSAARGERGNKTPSEGTIGRRSRLRRDQLGYQTRFPVLFPWDDRRILRPAISTVTWDDQRLYKDISKQKNLIFSFVLEIYINNIVGYNMEVTASEMMNCRYYVFCGFHFFFMQRAIISIPLKL